MRTASLKLVAQDRSGEHPTFTDEGSCRVFGGGGLIGYSESANVAADEIVIGKVGTVGSVRYVDRPIWATNNTTILAPRAQTSGRFLAYALSVSRLSDRAITTAQPYLPFHLIQDVSVPIHDFPTQRRIADYLDRETGEIDAMLAKLDEMAETLDQRRNDAIAQAIASHQTAPIGLLAEVTLGKMLQTRPQSPDDKPVPYMRAAHVQPKGMLDLAVQPHEMWASTQDMERLTLRAGDCVVVEGGVGGYGRAAFVSENIDGWVFQNSIIRLRGESPWVGKYLAYALVLARHRGEIAAACSAVAMPHFTAEKVEKFRVPYHSPAEQRHIAEHLDEVTGRIDAMLGKVAKLKELLTERRAALITEVVTGRKEV